MQSNSSIAQHQNNVTVNTLVLFACMYVGELGAILALATELQFFAHYEENIRTCLPVVITSAEVVVSTVVVNKSTLAYPFCIQCG